MSCKEMRELVSLSPSIKVHILVSWFISSATQSEMVGCGISGKLTFYLLQYVFWTWILNLIFKMMSEFE